MAIISEQTRNSILSLKAARQHEERKQKIQQIMSASHCDVLRAIEIYKERVVVGQPSDELINDLNTIAKELSNDATTCTA